MHRCYDQRTRNALRVSKQLGIKPQHQPPRALQEGKAFGSRQRRGRPHYALHTHRSALPATRARVKDAHLVTHAHMRTQPHSERKAGM